VPTLVHPYLPYNYGHYWPSPVEATIASGTLGLFVLLYFLFAKFSPMISIWEFEEGLQLAKATHAEGHPQGGDAVVVKVH